MEKILWKDSRKNENGWAYQSEVAQNFIKAMTSLAYELTEKGKGGKMYEDFFKETTNKVIDLMN